MPTSKYPIEQVALKYASALLYYGIETYVSFGLVHNQMNFMFRHKESQMQYKKSLSMYMLEGSYDNAKVIEHIFSEAAHELVLGTFEHMLAGDLTEKEGMEFEKKSDGWFVKQGGLKMHSGGYVNSKSPYYDIHYSAPELTKEDMIAAIKKVNDAAKKAYDGVPYWPKSGAQETNDSLSDLFDMSQEIVCDKKNGCGYHSSIKNVVIHMNDDHGMSREEIADYLESLDIDLKMKQTASTGGE